MPKVPRAARTIVEAAVEVQTSPDWQAAQDDIQQRAWLLTHAVCDALYLMGYKRIPSTHAILEICAKYRRDLDIYQNFDGRNYQTFVRRYGISERTVRRVIAKYRNRPPPPLVKY